jgi:DNA helicase II / ATP-dependent DNA helicase PcrA
MSINIEKQEIINCDGNILVTANPGTGKTLLLAHKYVDLLRFGIKPKDILCLTFTRKARKEMEDRITKLIKDEKIDVDLSDLNVHTFHSYALDNIDESHLVSPNLLRYSIFRYLKDHETLNYADSYLLDTIVPKMENLIRYLKSFGVTHRDIDVDDVKNYIADFKSFTKEELELFLEEFVKIYAFYEEIKGSHGLDYTDMLLDFLNLGRIPKFKYVLVDELQDVNRMEADISLRSAEKFIAVGDQKQAIFGFQGGSILNFKKFSDSTHFVLSENFRSTNPILDYSRMYFSTKTKEKHHCKDLEKLENKQKKGGTKPVIYDVPKDALCPAICKLVKKLSKDGEKVAVIARTNTQIMKISKEFVNQEIEHSSTFFSASADAQINIITFLKGILSKDINHVKAAMFTPFFPICLQDAFDLSEKRNLSIDDIYRVCPSFRKMRASVRNVEDINRVFKERIIPMSISYGEEYLQASLTMMDAFWEAIRLVDDKRIDNISAFLESTDLLGSVSNVEKNIVLTSVHKAKGKQFEKVIYVPSKTSDRSNFQDAVVTSILKSKGINAEEELEEETLRVDFVAFTRAIDSLFVVTDRPNEYLNDFAELREIDVDVVDVTDISELKKRAYNLFVNKEFDQAKKLLETKTVWIRDFVKNHFENIDHISFSALTDNAYDYFVKSILKISDYSSALSLGSDVHSLAEKIIKKEDFELSDELKSFKDNIEKLLDEIKNDYPHVAGAEENIVVPLNKLVSTDENIDFTGKLDAVFKNDSDDYLIVDWKTSKNDKYSSGHRQQLSAYKKAYGIKHGIPFDKINVAIGYIGLRNIINNAKISAKLDSRQPADSAFNTFSKHMNTFLSWKKDVDVFFKDLSEVKDDDVLLRSILEQYNMEVV